MTVALAWVRKHASLAWAFAAFVCGLVVAAFARSRPQPGPPAAPDPADTYDRRVAVAKARADIEIAAARTDNQQLLLRMHAVLSDPDPDRMVDDMVTLAEQARGAKGGT